MKTIKVVAAIIICEDRVFATQRGYGEFKGGWEFPGGKIEPGESPQEALKREIQEELGVSVVIDQFFCTAEYEYTSFHLTMHCYLCHIEVGEMMLHEHKSAKWLTSQSLDCVEWLPADLEIVERLKRLS